MNKSRIDLLEERIKRLEDHLWTVEPQAGAGVPNPPDRELRAALDQGYPGGGDKTFKSLKEAKEYMIVSGNRTITAVDCTVCGKTIEKGWGCLRKDCVMRK